jgi:hypothetical protein
LNSFEQRIATVTTNSPLHSALQGKSTPIAHGEMKQKLLFRHAVSIAVLALAMTGWVYALGWAALKLV